MPHPLSVQHAAHCTDDDHGTWKRTAIYATLYRSIHLWRSGNLNGKE
jgi:hypothetical protein